MAGSRTGTAPHRHFRREVLTRDQTAGITTCPICGATLNYHQSRQPNSAEADHIIPHSLGGTNHPDNGRTICRQCNQRRGNGRHAKAAKMRPRTHTTDITW
ncbi:HNH endonuclease [Trueperella pyogenes]|uniref:HNH endonuclease n=1 Tax=Trueperella pyogenes TaxID=1661 RepID=UPI00345D652B